MREIDFCSYCEKIKNKKILFENETAVAVYNKNHSGKSIIIISKYHEDYLETNNRVHSDFAMLIKNSIKFLKSTVRGLENSNFSIVYSHVENSHTHCVLIPIMINNVNGSDLYE